MAKSPGSFKPGTSGNPLGRPANTTPRAEFRKLVNPDLPEIVKTLVEAAKAGDIQAIKVIYDRIVPPLRSTGADVSLRLKGTLQARGETVINGLSRGAVAPEQAKEIMSTLAAQSKLVEQAEILDRIAQLESLVCPAKT